MHPEQQSMTKQAIPYIRYSSFRQSEGDSYRRQADLIESWLSSHTDYTKSNLVYDDLKKSGFSTKAGKAASGFIKIRQAIEAGLIRAGDCVLIEAIDRATRQGTFDALDLLTPILRAGVSIVTIDDGQEYTEQSLNGSQIFLLIAKLQAAHNYSKALSERVAASYKARRKLALAGEAIKRHTPVWLTADGAVIAEIAQQVALVFDWYIAGVGKHSIAAKIRLSGVEKLSKCSGPTVQGWLSNPAVIGSWANSDTDADSISGVYPAIIEPETFYLAQRLLKERSVVRARTSKHFLVGLVRCKHCEKSMVMHMVNGKPAAMRCLTHHRLKLAGCQNNKSIPINIIKLVQVLTSNLAFKRALAKQTLSASEKRKITLEAELDRVAKEIGKLVELAAVVDLAEVAEKLAALKAERGKLGEELKALAAGDKVLSESVKVLREETKLLESDSIVLNAMLKDSGYAIYCDIVGNVTTTENGKQWTYLGVKRKARSNTTEGYRLRAGEGGWSTTLLINPDVAVEVPAVLGDGEDAAPEEVDIRYARYAELVIEQEGEEEEHLDPPYVQWKRK